jgi:hypothetical protein
MTLLNPFSPHVPACATDTRCDDRSVLLMIWLLLGLVFAPVIGLHVAAVTSLVAPAADSVAHEAAPSKPIRG